MPKDPKSNGPTLYLRDKMELVIPKGESEHDLPTNHLGSDARMAGCGE